MQAHIRASFRRMSPLKAPALRSFREILEIPIPLRTAHNVALLFAFIKKSNFFVKLIEEVSEEVALQCCLVMTYESGKEQEVAAK